MRIQFCGADRTVTGSCHLLEINGLRLALDMGLSQGPRQKSRWRNEWLPDDPSGIDAVILSHGHLDHCGKLPVLTRAGYGGGIYCTPATAAVARIVLEDAAQIQEENAAYLNRRARQPDQPPITPLYRSADVQPVIRRFRSAGYNARTELGKGVWFTLLDAGHILGSAYVLLEWQHGSCMRSLVFTGDVGRYNTPIIADPRPLAGPVDVLITESTYGTVSHAPMDAVEGQLLDALRFCIERRSRLLVPSFAVGRTQTILWYLQKFIQEKQIPELPIFVDSPMGTEVSHVHSNFRDYYDQQTRQMIGQKDLFGLSRVTFAVSGSDSKRINSASGPCVIIASSPTCEFGRILHHLKLSVERTDDLVIFVGWTPPNTLGRRLQDGQRRVRILDRWYDVRCQIRTLHGLSAHADAQELLRFLAPTLSPRTSFHVVHGEPQRAEGFAAKLLSAGAARVSVPAMETAVMEA